MEARKERAKDDFIVRAIEDMAPHFVARTFGDEQPENTREHSGMLIFEELCSLFEDAGLAEGIWLTPDPRRPKTQPPFYRLLVAPEDTRAFLIAHPVKEDVTAGRVVTIWAELFEEYWTLSDGSHLPRFCSPRGYMELQEIALRSSMREREPGLEIDAVPISEDWRPISDSYRAQIERLALLGFVQIEGSSFRWHPWCHDRYSDFRRLYGSNNLTWPTSDRPGDVSD